MRRLQNELRACGGFWMASAALILATVGIVVSLTGCTDIGPIDPATGKNHRPWNDDPYAIGKDAHWMDRKVWRSHAEAARQTQWMQENPPRDTGDYLFRN